jgi:hypothetical protein
VFVGLGDLSTRLNADIANRFSKILKPTVPDFDATFLIATFLSPSLALILDDDLLECAKNNVKHIVSSFMFPISGDTYLP